MKFFKNSINSVSSPNQQITPIQYFGQREAIIPDLFKLLGKNKYQCLYDPFSGSGSVSFAAMDQDLAQHYYISDSFEIFKHLWELIKTYPQAIIDDYTKYLYDYYIQPKEKRNNFYNQLLKKFNESNQAGFYAKAAIMFVFLINFADKNMPFFDNELRLATQANVFINPDDEKIKITEFSQRTTHVSNLINKYKTHFDAGDFLPCLKTVTQNDLVILDPPYPSQAHNVYFKLQQEKKLYENLRIALDNLNQKKVDFILLYGARIVKLDNQFDEEKFGVYHLLRLSTHQVFGHFLDHIYVSRNMALNIEKLPAGMTFYNKFFTSNQEMSSEKYEEVLSYLHAQKYNLLAQSNEQLMAKL